MTFLKRRVSAAVWELLLLLVAAIIFATVYRILFQPRRDAHAGLRKDRGPAER